MEHVQASSPRLLAPNGLADTASSVFETARSAVRLSKRIVGDARGWIRVSVAISTRSCRVKRIDAQTAVSRTRATTID
jgi:hypothetical protein